MHDGFPVSRFWGAAGALPGGPDCDRRRGNAVQQRIEPPSTIEADLARLEVGIRQLKVQYDMFLNGALAKEPLELRVELDAIIRRHANTSIRKYAHRFHLNTLVSRYNSLLELWGKTLRTREEGDRPNPRIVEQRAGARDPERVLESHRVRSVEASDRGLRRLHDSFNTARQRVDPDARPIRFEAFVQGVGRESSRIRERHGCEGVELRVVMTESGVQLKARPARS